MTGDRDTERKEGGEREVRLGLCGMPSNCSSGFFVSLHTSILGHFMRVRNRHQSIISSQLHWGHHDRGVANNKDTKVMSSIMFLWFGGFKDLRRSLHSTITKILHMVGF